MKKIKEKKGRKIIQYFFAALVPLVIFGGIYQPYLGFLALTMMITMMGMAFFWGRLYCGWICAMGSFHERVLARVSLKREMPELFKKSWFRWFFFVALMGLMVSRLIMSGGDPAKVGAVFVMMWTVSTVIAVAIGLYYKPRSWCNFCPMASMMGVLTPKTYLLRVASDCKQCGLCQKVCPIQTNPGGYKDQGFVPSLECMRCENCVVNCPKQALTVK